MGCEIAIVQRSRASPCNTKSARVLSRARSDEQSVCIPGLQVRARLYDVGQLSAVVSLDESHRSKPPEVPIAAYGERADARLENARSVRHIGVPIEAPLCKSIEAI